jgi:hypothetical protein
MYHDEKSVHCPQTHYLHTREVKPGFQCQLLIYKGYILSCTHAKQLVDVYVAMAMPQELRHWQSNRNFGGLVYLRVFSERQALEVKPCYIPAARAYSSLAGTDL